MKETLTNETIETNDPSISSNEHPIGELIDKLEIQLTVNGELVKKEVESRMLLSDFLRDILGLTGTHLGCEHGVCGACTILVNGEAVRSCLMFAFQADNMEVTTVESLVNSDGKLNALQESFSEHHALQCGFCTPGFLMSLTDFLGKNSNPTDEEIREAIAGNLCRCTGYSNIIKAVKSYCAKQNNR